jgi:putative spermidine/putrescine transport system substrate-binding protein
LRAPKNHNRVPRRTTSAAVALACAAGVIGGADGAAGASSFAKYSAAESAGAFGGMNDLVKAAKAEGTLNVITLPTDWANYGAIMHDFTAKYGIKIVDENPDGSSQDEINAMVQLKGQSRGPDVLDMGTPFAVKAAQMGLLAPYEVETWSDIPAGAKAPNADWWADYGGYVAIGYNSATVKKPPTTFKSLLNPIYKNMVGINGNPTEAGAAFSAVYASTLANGGSLDNIMPGIEYFAKLRQEGIYVPTTASPTTVESGATPIVIWWDYLQESEIAAQVKTWKVVIPSDGIYAGYYDQAISKDAPHPAAARLWEEFLYSTEGQNLWLEGQARPIELPTLVKDGTVNQAAYKALPPVPKGTVHIATAVQMTAAEAVLAKEWSVKVG